MKLVHVQQVLKELVPVTLEYSTKPEARRMRRIVLKNTTAAIGCAKNLLDLLQAETPPQRVFCRTTVDPHAIVLQMINLITDLPPTALPYGEIYTTQIRDVVGAFVQIRKFPLWFAPGGGELTENLFGLPADVAFEPEKADKCTVFSR